MRTKATILSLGCRGPVAQRRIVYWAMPLDLFDHPSYGRVRLFISRYFPARRFAVFEPSRMPWTTREWLKTWPRLRYWIDALVIWPRPDRSIGFGCYGEVCDVQCLGKPVYVIASDGTLRSLAGFTVLRDRSPIRYARVRVGKAIRPGKMPGEAGHAA